jgi:hypothetical protein
MMICHDFIMLLAATKTRVCKCCSMQFLRIYHLHLKKQMRHWTPPQTKRKWYVKCRSLIFLSNISQVVSCASKAPLIALAFKLEQGPFGQLT